LFSPSFTSVALLALAEGELLPWWVNYPGLELWKFANLFLFILAAFLLHRRLGKPLREALRSRTEGIKRELQKAREERDVALAKLSEVEARLANLDAEVAAVKDRARAEAEAEKARLTLSTEKDLAKIKEQASREIESAAKAAKQELRRFAAEESVRLAENILKQEIKPEDDARLASLNVEELGRVQA
jgi:F0F1-type ATP synthase membrane subunit b/b'